MDEIENALAPLQFHDACHECGKRSDGLMTCIYPDGDTIKLCPDCIQDSGFCLMCGNYCAGMSSFDFSEMPGYCAECVEEIKNEWDEDDELYPYDDSDFAEN
jgi:hypothetical protein